MPELLGNHLMIKFCEYIQEVGIFVRSKGQLSRRELDSKILDRGLSLNSSALAASPRHEVSTLDHAYLLNHASAN
jgi:hypothetical protein